MTSHPCCLLPGLLSLASPPLPGDLTPIENPPREVPESSDDTGPDDLRARFGFAGFEIYELGGVFDLTTGDLDGDGRSDLGVANNAHSRLDLLVRLDPESPAERDDSRRDDDPNPIEYDGRFRHTRLAVERRVLQLEFADLDGDGSDEVVFAGQDGYLTAVFDATAEETLRSVVTRRFDALRKGCELLRAEDLDGDGRAELLAAGNGVLFTTGWDAAERAWSPPRVLDHLDGRVDALYTQDLDGDGRRDLLYVHTLSDRPLRLRLASEATGGFGPRIDFDLPQIRAAAVRDLDLAGGAEVLVVQRLSGRLTAYELVFDGEAPALEHYALGEAHRAGDRPPGFAVGDLDGDGAADVVVTAPGAAEVALYAGRRDGRPLEPRSFPSLVGVSDPHIGDVDGDGHPDLCLISGPERMLGVVSLDPAGRLPFPRTWPVAGEPVALALGDLDGDGRQDALVAVSEGEGRSRKTALAVWLGSEGGLADEPVVHELPAVKKTPSALEVADLDRDGRLDVVLFVPGESSVPTFLIQTDSGFVTDERGEDAPGLGVLAGAGPARIAWVDADGDGQRELIAAAAHFARTLHVDVVTAEERTHLSPIVIEQFNAPHTDADIEGVAVLEPALEKHGGDARSQIVLYDRRNSELLILERDSAGAAVVAQRVPAHGLDFLDLVTADVDGDGGPDLVVLGKNEFAVLHADAARPAFRAWASYESPKEHAFLDHVVVGDLDADGRPDVIVSESVLHALELIAAGDRSLQRALGFKIFEESDLSQNPSTGEPRELVCADLTGDDKDDLAVLVHDKLILYVQE